MTSIARKRGRPRKTPQDAALKAAWLLDVALALVRMDRASLMRLGVSEQRAITLIKRRHRGLVGEYVNADLVALWKTLVHRALNGKYVGADWVALRRELASIPQSQEGGIRRQQANSMAAAIDAVLSGDELKLAARFFMVDLRGLRRRVKSERQARAAQHARVAAMRTTVSDMTSEFQDS